MATKNTTASAKDEVLYFITFLNKEDFKNARECINDDMTFEGVLGSRSGADDYIKDMEKMKFKYEIKKVFEDGDDVCVLYDINMGKAAIYTCGWYHIKDHKISSLKVVFDPRPLLNADSN